MKLTISNAIINQLSGAQMKDFPFDNQSLEEVKSLAALQQERFDIPKALVDLMSANQSDKDSIAELTFAVFIQKHTKCEEVLISSVSSDKLKPVVQLLKYDFTSDDITQIAVEYQPDEENTDLHRFVLSTIPFEELPQSMRDTAAIVLQVQKDALVWNCDPQSLSSNSVKLLNGRFLKLLGQILSDTTTDLTSLDMISEEEDAMIQSLSQGTNRSIRNDVIGYAALFEEQVALVPNKVAVRDTALDEELTFAQLNTSAEALASHLQTVLSPTSYNPRIAVLVPRTVNLFVSLVASLKAGGAYVPIDPTYPSERIEFILEDSSSNVVIATKDCMSLIPESYQGTSVCLEDVLASATEERVEARIKPQVKIEDVMLILYTSGTTGKPKGVAIQHRSAMYFVENSFWDCMTNDDIWAQMSNPCFIGSINDIWLPLVKGAAAVILPKDVLMDMSVLRKTLVDERVSCLFLTPKVFELASDVDTTLFDGLKLVQFAGEAVRLDAVMKVAGRPEHLQHLYGCTERMGCISGYEVPAKKQTDVDLGAVQPAVPRLPVGKPISNTACYVLDSNMKPVPIGMPGELYVGGPQIARGYINRDEATAEKFLPNPFAEGKMYRTGDLARWLPDGRGLDLMGRIDSMIKINGYRIELGEIEASIMEETQLGVVASVVITRELPTQAKILCAYVTPETVDTKKLRERLQEKLPSYLLPKSIIAIPAVPLTPNGKLDRRALPTSDARGENTFVAPQTEHERVVVDVWASLLGVDVVSTDSTFEELGGHSLLVMKVLNELNKHCPALQVSDLLEYETPAEIAGRMDELGTEAASLDIPDWIVKYSRNREGEPGVQPVFVLHGGPGTTDWAAGFNKHMENRPLYGIRMTRAVIEAAKKNKSESKDFMAALCEQYLIGVRAVQPHGPYKFGGYSLGAYIALEMTYILEQEGEVVEQLISFDMPVGHFDKMAAFMTAQSYHEKAPALVAFAYADFYCKDKAKLQRELDIFLPKLDSEVIGGKDDESRAFVTIASAREFMERCDMPHEDVVTVHWGLQNSYELFVDILDRGHIIKADVLNAVASDNRLMIHLLKSSNLEHLIEDYGWSVITSGKVESVVIEGNHVNMVNTDEGKRIFGEILDA